MIRAVCDTNRDPTYRKSYDMSSIASIAARIAGQTLPIKNDAAQPTLEDDRSTRPKLPWRRPRRTKAIASAKLLAIQAAVDMLNTSRGRL